MRRVWKFAVFGICVIAAVLGFAFWRTGHGEHARLETFVNDVRNGRSHGYQVFAYRLNKYALEALAKKPWQDVQRELTRQGASFGDFRTGPSENSTFASYILPGATIELKPGVALEARMLVWRGAVTYANRPTLRTVRDARGVLAIPGEFDFSDLAGLPKSTLIGKIWGRPNLAKLALEYPKVNNFQISHTDGRFLVSFQLTDGARTASLTYDVVSGLTSRPRRPIPWLPISLVRSEDSLGAITAEGENGSNTHATDNYSMIRKGHKWESLPPSREVFSNADLDALADDTDRLILSPDQLILDASKIRRLVSLKSLEIRSIPELAMIQECGALPKLEALSILVPTSKVMREVAKLSGLRKLHAISASSEADVLHVLAALPNLEDLFLHLDTPITDPILKAVGRLPNLEHLTLYGSRGYTMAGVSALTKAPKLKSLTLPGIRPEEAHAIFRMPLRKLFLPNGELDTGGLRILAKNQHIREITLSRTKGLTDDNIQILAKLQNADFIGLNGQGLTPAGAKRLKEGFKGRFIGL